MDNVSIAGTSKRCKIPRSLDVPLWTDEMVQYDALNSSSLERKRERGSKRHVGRSIDAAQSWLSDD